MQRRLEMATAEKLVRDNRDWSPTREETERVGFWDNMAIVLLLGAIIGFAASLVYYERCLEEAIKLQRFVHKNVRYEIRQVKLTVDQ